MAVSKVSHNVVATALPTTPTNDEEKWPNNDTNPPPEGYEYITGLKLYLVLASVTLIAFLIMLDMSIIVTAIPQITTDFHALSDVGWYGSAYLLANCALQPLTGKLYTQFSSKYTFLSFLALFELGSTLCGAAQSSNMLIIGRAVAGLGGSGLTNGALTILGAAVPLEKRAAVLGIMFGLSQTGAIAAPLLGGALTQYASWRWCFYINLPIGGVISAFLLMIRIPDRVEHSSKSSSTALMKKLDLAGFLIFAPSSVMFLMALQWGGTQYPWNSATIIGLFSGSGVSFIVFVLWEYRVGDDAMVPLSIIRQQVVWSACLFIAFFFGAIVAFSYYMPIYFQVVRGVSPTLSGVYLLPSILSQMVLAVVSGLLVSKMHHYFPWAVASAVFTSIGCGLLSTLSPNTSSGKWIGYQILLGIGRGCGFQMPIIAIQNTLSPQQNPIGMALVGFSQTLGGSIFLSLAQTIFSRSLIDGLAQYAPGVDANQVIKAGGSGLRQTLPVADLPGALKAFNLGVDHTFYLATGASAATFVLAFTMGWHRIGTKEAIIKD
ncbi:efflux pump [Tothia fuscella]|uniref:Efflux pump n=1 Tax=Tothia fuscella TaxID=1048955 RepID=A0A9P4TVZ8_9PEZI|nr:efflux pump [Tothia fuscella]